MRLACGLHFGLVWAVLAIFANPTGALNLRNPFTARSSDLRSGDAAKHPRDPRGAQHNGLDTSTAAEGDAASRGGSAASRHQVNGVVTLQNGSYDFTYRPIAGKLCVHALLPVESPSSKLQCGVL